MTPVPLLALQTRQAIVDPLRAVLAELGDRCRIAAYEPSVGGSFAGAVIVGTGSWPSVPDHLPRAYVVDTVDEASEVAQRRGVVAVMSADAAAPASVGTGLRLPQPIAATDGARPVAPHVRTRLRRAAGLDDVAVADVRSGTLRWCGRLVAPHLVDTVLASCAVAIVDPGSLPRAAAWATPCVMREVDADVPGIGEGTVALAASDACDEVALRTASDLRRAALLSAAGRRWYEEWHDPRAAAIELAHRLGLEALAGAARVAHRAGELGARPSDPVLARARQLISGLDTSEAPP